MIASAIYVLVKSIAYVSLIKWLQEACQLLLIQNTSKIKLPSLFFRFISCISLTEWWQGAQTTKMLRWRHEEWGCTSHKKHVSWAESSYHGELLAHIGGTLIVRKPFRFVPWTSQKLHSTIVEDYWSGLLLGLFVGQIIAQSRKAHLCPTGHVEVPRIEWELVEMQIENFTYEGSWMFYSKTFLLQQNYQLVTPEIKCINKIKQKNMESIGTGSGLLKILTTYSLERSSTCWPLVSGSLNEVWVSSFENIMCIAIWIWARYVRHLLAEGSIDRNLD